ncbi:IclR family transcriptional regulator [Streptomyces carpinensis]|uniref:IclR family transcriptional regulator n=1 Tax=Streptomyces carpinensis TaxID=66369 RepID=A0ABV1VW84_9ACTN|nr:IclR family transcriptional regulator [Streptomyces carpinensis]
MTAVDRAMRTLEYLANPNGRTTHTALVKQLGIAPSTLTELLRQLRGLGWVDCVEDEYRLGASAFAFASQVRPSARLRAIVAPVLASLARATGETAVLTVELPGEGVVMIVDAAEGANRVRFVAQVGERIPMHHAPGGLVLLAFSERGLGDIEGHEQHTSGPFGDVDKQAFARRLRRIRKLGYAELTPHEEPGQHAISAPILDRAGSPIAAVTLVGPASRMKPNAKKLADLLVSRISELRWSED